MTKALDEEPNPPGVNVGDAALGVRSLAPRSRDVPFAFDAEEAIPAAGSWRALAAALGFARVGVAPVNAATLAREAEAMASTEHWVAAELHGALAYMATPRSSPGDLLQGAKSVIVGVATTEDVGALPPLANRGRVAAYAKGRDYHGVLKTKLWQLAQQLSDDLQAPLRARVCVDTAPLLERFWAAQAGVTFTGKSTMAIAPGVGSNVMLGALIVDVPLPHDYPLPLGCGECTLCLDACPTRAFVGPFVLDAARCIATLTIESAGDIAEELRPGLGDRVFGCDECQTVCPYNASRKRPGPMPDLAASEERRVADLHHWASLTSGDYKRLTRQSALRRVPRAQLQRNAVTVLGNAPQPTTEDAQVLERVVLTNPSPLVRKHAAWALTRVDPERARTLLTTLCDTEQDDAVRTEVERLRKHLDAPED